MFDLMDQTLVKSYTWIRLWKFNFLKNRKLKKKEEALDRDIPLLITVEHLLCNVYTKPTQQTLWTRRESTVEGKFTMSGSLQMTRQTNYKEWSSSSKEQEKKKIKAVIATRRKEI